MAREASVVAGSGITPGLEGVPARQDGSKRLTGTAVAIINPEDNSAHGVLLNTQQTVGTSAAALPTSPLDGRRSISVFNTDDTATLYIGSGSGVTTDNGYPVGPGTAFSAELGGNVELWGVSTTDIDVRVLEVS
jgi:hypothetical protein